MANQMAVAVAATNGDGEKKTVADLPIPLSLKGLTRCETVQDFFELHWDGEYLCEILVNPKPAVETPAPNRIVGIDKIRALINGSFHLILGRFTEVRIGYHAFAYDKSMAQQDGVVMALTPEGDWQELDWKKARGKLVAAYRPVPKARERVHDEIDTILSGQSVILNFAWDSSRGAGFQDYFLEALDQETPEKAIEYLNQKMEAAHTIRVAKAKGARTFSEEELHVIELPVHGEKDKFVDVVFAGQKLYELYDASGNFVRESNFDPAKTTSRQLYKQIAAEGWSIAAVA